MTGFDGSSLKDEALFNVTINSINLGYFDIYEQLNFHAQLYEHEKSFITFGPGLTMKCTKTGHHVITKIVLYGFKLQNVNELCHKKTCSRVLQPSWS